MPVNFISLLIADLSSKSARATNKWLGMTWPALSEAGEDLMLLCIKFSYRRLFSLSEGCRHSACTGFLSKAAIKMLWSYTRASLECQGKILWQKLF